VKISVTEKALKLRLRRALQTQGKHLRITTRQEQRKFGLGRYYLLFYFAHWISPIQLQNSRSGATPSRALSQLGGTIPRRAAQPGSLK
jgi:hypothetical protein